jgi:Amt family ammonium transporter
MTGSLLVAIFALPALGGVGYADGMDLSRQLVAQLLGVLTVIVWSAGWTFALVKIVGAVCGIRVSVEEENDGLDLATHGERAYDHS